jgi:hypothetical protein
VGVRGVPAGTMSGGGGDTRVAAAMQAAARANLPQSAPGLQTASHEAVWAAYTQQVGLHQAQRSVAQHQMAAAQQVAAQRAAAGLQQRPGAPLQQQPPPRAVPPPAYKARACCPCGAPACALFRVRKATHARRHATPQKAAALTFVFSRATHARMPTVACTLR